MTTTFIVKNGKGGHVEASAAMRLGYDFNGYHLFSGGYKYAPFEVAYCQPEDLLDMSIDETTLFRTETGHVYKALS
jgi:hypothetical protein